MRLSDHIAAQCGGEEDIAGIFTNTSAVIQQAERFELSDDVARASYNLTRLKPSSLLNTLPLCRAPYRKMWLEWRGGITTEMIPPENRRDPRIAPEPLKQGVLIETDETGQRGTMTFAWVHKHRDGVAASGVNICPLGSLFNWDEGGNVHEDAIVELRKRYPSPKARIALCSIDSLLVFKNSQELTDNLAKEWMARSSFHQWSKHASVIGERRALQTLHKHHMPFLSSHCLGFVEWCVALAAENDRMDTFLTEIVHNSWEDDIEGEPPFAETIIGMMNSRNTPLEHRAVDLAALNKQRAKRGRALFLPYRTTHLRLSQAQTRAFRAGLISREQAGQHTVRGHFKVRKTGIYWWSPFYRGDPTRPLHRQEYEVA